MGLLRQTAKEQGAAVLCSLHQISLSRTFADRIIGLREGRIVFDGPPGQLSQDMLARIRITSYNVCYTKLLRLSIDAVSLSR